MVDWLDDLVDYLISIEQRNTFFWCLNPNSGDTGGLLQNDWTTEESGKLEALDLLQPFPSKIEWDSDSNTVCISFDGALNPSPSTTESTTTTTEDEVTSTESIVVTTEDKVIEVSSTTMTTETTVDLSTSTTTLTEFSLTTESVLLE